MAKDDKSESLGEAKVSPRLLEGRMKPAAAVAVPRNLSIGSPTAAGEPLGQRVNGGDKATHPPFILVTFPNCDESAISSKQGEGRPRRCYDAEERRQVADTRKRGACEACRASKTKCLHDPSKVATEKYRTQPQSHERFALGLTTESLTANEDGHKQVIMEEIAAYDDNMVKAQEDPPRPNQDTNNDGDTKVAPVVVPILPPDVNVSKSPTSQQQNHPVELHQTPFHQGMGMGVFKLEKLGVPGKRCQPNRGSAKATTVAPSGAKRTGSRKAPASPPLIVCQGNSISSVASPTAIKQPYNKNLSTWRPALQENVTRRSAPSPKRIQPGCKAFQQSFATHLKGPNDSSPQSPPERLSPRRYSNISEQDNNTMATDESMLSLGRSPSPFSEHSSSKPPSFVQLSDLEHSKSHNLVVPDHQIALWSRRVAREQAPPALDDMDLDDSDDIPSSFEEYLNADWDDTTLLSRSTATDFTTSQSGMISLDGSTSKSALRNQKLADIAEPMEIDT